MMKQNSEQNQSKDSLNSLDEKVQKLKTSMMYYFKSKKSHENLLMFVMDV